MFNNSIKIQWGMVAGTARNQEIVYPVSLQNKVFYINGHPIYSSITGNHDYDPNFITESLSHFIIYCDPGGGVNAKLVNWYCIGS